jgi:hypothetical protein
MVAEFGLPIGEFSVSGPGLVLANGFPLRVLLAAPSADIEVAFVPEPAVAVLQAAALLALAGPRRRRSRHAGGSADVE